MATLTQNSRCIAYFSQTLAMQELPKSIYEELIAMVLAVKKWRHTCQGGNSQLYLLNLIVWGSISKPIGNVRSSPSTLYGV